ncbi:hypothetical protein [Nonomuraea basaltis]|nr:hypothetical protein [Nonomuraea basaltis]
MTKDARNKQKTRAYAAYLCGAGAAEVGGFEQHPVAQPVQR